MIYYKGSYGNCDCVDTSALSVCNAPIGNLGSESRDLHHYLPDKDYFWNCFNPALAGFDPGGRSACLTGGFDSSDPFSDNRSADVFDLQARFLAKADLNFPVLSPLVISGKNKTVSQLSLFLRSSVPAGFRLNFLFK
jgi:hypothetical protein